jgi:hypothetical protein
VARYARSEASLPAPSYAVDFTHYATSAEVVLFLDQLEAAYPDLVEVIHVGDSWQARPIMAIRIGNEVAGDVDARPALYVDGQHHAREAVSSEAVLYFLWYLVSEYGADPLVTRLLDTRTVYAIPLINPDGNDIFLEADRRMRRTANPSVSDDDGDTLYDEDGREGAGYGTYDVYHYEFEPAWVAAHPDNPLVDGWWNHVLAQTYVGIFDYAGHEVAQIDDDGDGSAGEDPPGGVDANRNYDSHWELGDDNPISAIYHGPAPFSERETSVVRDFVLAHPNIVLAATYHSGSDILLHPWGWSAFAELPDLDWYTNLSRKGTQLTERNGFEGAPYAWTARDLYPGSGSTMDWLYEHGILAWTPETYAASSVSSVDRIAATNVYSVSLSVGEGFNPPPEEMGLTVDRWLYWNLYLLAVAPNVGLSSVEATDTAVTLTVANDGLLPIDVEVVLATAHDTYTMTIPSLASGTEVWQVDRAARPRWGTATIVLTGTTNLGLVKVEQVESYRVRIVGDTLPVRIVQGRLEPFVELGGFFGGWYADPESGTPG